jgi:hypothetical protein
VLNSFIDFLLGSRELRGDPVALGQRVTVRVLLFVFLMICVFDPADRMVGGKVVIFVALWGATCIGILSSGRIIAPPAVVAYVAMFIAIPAASIAVYYVLDGRAPFEGFSMLKGYLLISLTLVLVVNRIKLLGELSAVLTLLACCVIAVFVAIMMYPGLYDKLFAPGNATGLLSLDRRPYGDNISLLQVYFVTTPMLVVSVAYYFDRAMSVDGAKAKLFFASITAINVVGMFVAGSRNNIFISLLTPWALWPLYAKRRAVWLICSLAGAPVLALLSWNYLLAFLDPTETANQMKLGTINDYWEILGQPVTLLFGQGLGAYQHWSIKEYSYVSELTYFELLRNFGVFGGAAMMGLLLAPLATAIGATDRRELSMAIAWLLYLVMCASNPNLFSSMGILILSILIADSTINRQERAEEARA